MIDRRTDHDYLLPNYAASVALQAGYLYRHSLIEQRGPEAMIDRSLAIKHWYTRLLKTMNEINPELALQFSEQTPRLYPLFIVDDDLPDDIKNYSSGLSSTAGFTLSRLYGIGREPRRNYDLMQKIDHSFLNSLKYTQTPFELVILFANEIVTTTQVKPPQVFAYLFNRRFVEATLCKHDFEEMAWIMHNCTPSLWRAYNKLSSRDIQTYGIDCVKIAPDYWDEKSETFVRPRKPATYLFQAKDEFTITPKPRDFFEDTELGEQQYTIYLASVRRRNEHLNNYLTELLITHKDNPWAKIG